VGCSCVSARHREFDYARRSCGAVAVNIEKRCLRQRFEVEVVPPDALGRVLSHAWYAWRVWRPGMHRVARDMRETHRKTRKY
jgi:hypothetical protein